MSLEEKFQNLAKRVMDAIPKPVDPEVFNDELALKTDWTPLVKGGTNYSERKFEQETADRLSVAATLQGILFPVIIISAAITSPIVLVFGFDLASLPKPMLIAVLAIMLSMFVVFGGVGYYLLKRALRKTTFDKVNNNFKKGYEILCSLDEIHAIQLIKEFIESEDSSYYSYELNLVLKDASRINVLDQGGKPSLIISEAEKLADFLDLPIWNAI